MEIIVNLDGHFELFSRSLFSPTTFFPATLGSGSG